MLFIPKNKLTYALCNSTKNICIVLVYVRHKFVSQCIVRPSKQACLTWSGAALNTLSSLKKCLNSLKNCRIFFLYTYSTLSNILNTLRYSTLCLLFFFSFFSSTFLPILLLLYLLSPFFSCFVLPNHPLFSIFLSLFYVPFLICLWLLSLHHVCDNFKLETVEVETF